MIQPSRPDDAPALLAIWRDAVDATHDFLAAEDRDAIERLVGAQYLPAADLLVARGPDGAPFGFLGGNGRHIDALFVGPRHHGQGIGSLLLAAFDEQGEGPLTVDVNEQNEAGRRFYERRGFAIAGRSERDDQGRPYPLLHLVRPVRD